MSLNYKIHEDGKLIAAFKYAEDAVRHLVLLPVGAKILFDGLVVLKAKGDGDRYRWGNSYDEAVIELKRNLHAALEARGRRYASYGQKGTLLQAAHDIGKLEIVAVGGAE